MERENRIHKTPGLVCCLMFLVLFGGLTAATRINPVSGNWATAGTWAPSGSPVCGDSVVITAGTTVSITNQQNYNSCMSPLKIVVKGHLKFFNGSKLSLPCGSYVIVYPGGKIEADVGLNNSNFIEICGNIEWNSNAPLDGPACIPQTSPMCQGILPIELNGFRAQACSFNKVCLSWETESEKNNDYFQLERSADANNFEAIAKIQSQAADGNSSARLWYAYIDDSPVAGYNYYRIRQVDKDHSQNVSDIVYVQSMDEKNAKAIIYPNSNAGEFTVLLGEVSTGQSVELQIKNSVGEVLFEHEYFAAGSETKIEVKPLSKLPDGIYLCSIRVGRNISNCRLMVN